jgi:hypothetical protein
LRSLFHSGPDIAEARLRAEPEQRLERDINEASGMAPVLEKPPRWSIGRTFQKALIVRSQPGEERHEVCSRDHVDRVDLELCQPVRHRLDVAHREWSLGFRHAEALRSERDPPRLRLTQLFPSH